MGKDLITITISVPDGNSYIGTSRGEGYTMNQKETSQQLRELATLLDNACSEPTELDNIEFDLNELLTERENFLQDEDGYTWEEGHDFYEYLSDELLHLLNEAIDIIKSKED